jgi:hypothetical protein
MSGLRDEILARDIPYAKLFATTSGSKVCPALGGHSVAVVHGAVLLEKLIVAQLVTNTGFLWYMISYSVYKSCHPFCILIQMNPIHALFLNYHYLNARLTSGVFHSGLLDKICMNFSSIPFVLHSQFT